MFKWKQTDSVRYKLFVLLPVTSDTTKVMGHPWPPSSARKSILNGKTDDSAFSRLLDSVFRTKLKTSSDRGFGKPPLYSVEPFFILHHFTYIQLFLLEHSILCLYPFAFLQMKDDASLHHLSSPYNLLRKRAGAVAMWLLALGGWGRNREGFSTSGSFIKGRLCR